MVKTLYFAINVFLGEDPCNPLLPSGGGWRGGGVTHPSVLAWLMASINFANVALRYESSTSVTSKLNINLFKCTLVT